VLVIEDDRAFAQIVRDLAHELEFQCLVARAAEEGLRLARAYQPVAIVLDVGLPDQSGLTVLESLKRDPATRHVPIHVVSVHDHRQLAREMGAVGYVLKPVGREELVAAFRSLEARLSRTMKGVLVVEDDAVQRDAIARLLAADDVRVVAVATATEALDELRSQSFDCVVLDLMLPDVSGLELLDRMSEDENYPFPPVIVYTARTLSPDEEQRLLRAAIAYSLAGDAASLARVRGRYQGFVDRARAPEALRVALAGGEDAELSAASFARAASDEQGFEGWVLKMKQRLREKGGAKAAVAAPAAAPTLKTAEATAPAAG
jgi:DNA-binding response OmpR family regulator